MDIKEFVSETLVSISKGIEEANIKLGREVLIGKSQNGSSVVEFDIAATIEKSDKISGKASIYKIVAASITGENNNSTVSRIKFSAYVNPETRETLAIRAKEQDIAYQQSRK